MALDRRDPFRTFNFTITLLETTGRPGPAIRNTLRSVRDAAHAGFSECSGLDLTLEVETRREGGNNGTILQFPRRVTWSNLRLKRGLTQSDDLFDWHYQFVRGRFASRRDGLIVLQDEASNPVKAWSFHRGLPVRWAGPALSAERGEVAFEEIEIAHEGLELVSSAAAASRSR